MTATELLARLPDDVRELLHQSIPANFREWTEDTLTRVKLVDAHGKPMPMGDATLADWKRFAALQEAELEQLEREREETRAAMREWLRDAEPEGRA